MSLAKIFSAVCGFKTKGHDPRHHRHHSPLEKLADLKKVDPNDIDPPKPKKAHK